MSFYASLLWALIRFYPVPFPLQRIEAT
jgi:hypothetical protein